GLACLLDEGQAMGAEAGDGDEGVAGAQLAAVHHQPGNGEVARQRDVGQQARQRHRAAHGMPPAIGGGRGESITSGSSIAFGSGGTSAWRLASPLAWAASQVSMSSGGTSISRSAPSMIRWNTGADTQPPP